MPKNIIITESAFKSLVSEEIWFDRVGNLSDINTVLKKLSDMPDSVIYAKWRNRNILGYERKCFWYASELNGKPIIGSVFTLEGFGEFLIQNGFKKTASRDNGTSVTYQKGEIEINIEKEVYIYPEDTSFLGHEFDKFRQKMEANGKWPADAPEEGNITFMMIKILLSRLTHLDEGQSKLSTVSEALSVIKNVPVENICFKMADEHRRAIEYVARLGENGGRWDDAKKFVDDSLMGSSIARRLKEMGWDLVRFKENERSGHILQNSYAFKKNGISMDLMDIKSTGGGFYDDADSFTGYNIPQCLENVELHGNNQIAINTVYISINGLTRTFLDA